MYRYIPVGLATKILLKAIHARGGLLPASIHRAGTIALAPVCTSFSVPVQCSAYINDSDIRS